MHYALLGVLGDAAAVPLPSASRNLVTKTALNFRLKGGLLCGAVSVTLVVLVV